MLYRSLNCSCICVDKMNEWKKLNINIKALLKGGHTWAALCHKGVTWTSFVFTTVCWTFFMHGNSQHSTALHVIPPLGVIQAHYGFNSCTQLKCLYGHIQAQEVWLVYMNKLHILTAMFCRSVTHLWKKVCTHHILLILAINLLKTRFLFIQYSRVSRIMRHMNLFKLQSTLALRCLSFTCYSWWKCQAFLPAPFPIKQNYNWQVPLFSYHKFI